MVNISPVTVHQLKKMICAQEELYLCLALVLRNDSDEKHTKVTIKAKLFLYSPPTSCRPSHASGR